MPTAANTPAARIITAIEITFAEVDHSMEQRVLGNYSDLDGLNRAFRSIHNSQNHDAYCKTDVRFTWSDGEAETIRFDIFGKKAQGQDPCFEAIVGRWLKDAREAAAAPRQGRSVTGFASKAEAAEHVTELTEFFHAVCAFKAEIVTSAPQLDADATIAALRAELAEAKAENEQLQREYDAQGEELEAAKDLAEQFAKLKTQLRGVGALIESMELDG